MIWSTEHIKLIADDTKVYRKSISEIDYGELQVDIQQPFEVATAVQCWKVQGPPSRAEKQVRN